MASADRPAGTSSGGTAGTQSSGTAGTIAGGTAAPCPEGKRRPRAARRQPHGRHGWQPRRWHSRKIAPRRQGRDALAGDGKTGERHRTTPDYLVAAESVWQRFGGADTDFSLLDDLPRLPDERKADLVEMHFLRIL